MRRYCRQEPVFPCLGEAPCLGDKDVGRLPGGENGLNIVGRGTLFSPFIAEVLLTPRFNLEKAVVGGSFGGEHGLCARCSFSWGTPVILGTAPALPAIRASPPRARSEWHATENLH